MAEHSDLSCGLTTLSLLGRALLGLGRIQEDIRDGLVYMKKRVKGRFVTIGMVSHTHR